MALENYYEILGVREDALDEEIRDRWIELVKDCHPDLEGEDPVDERIKEINEAYQVLKQPTTRFEYDLQRECERRMERTPRRRKLVIPAVGLVILLAIAGWLYFDGNEDPVQISSRGHIIVGVPILSAPVTNDPVANSPMTNGLVSNDSMTNDSMTTNVVSNDLMTSDPMTDKPQKVPITKKAEVKTSKVTSKVAASKRVFTDEKKPKPEAQPRAQGEAKPLDLFLPKPVLAQTTHPKASLLASKEEVKTFFTNYVNAYNQKNLGALITLFSSKAIQNNSERYDEIKRSFARFFVQSRDIRYRMEDLKFEIYENAVEATAAYEIVQVMRRWGENKTWKGDIRWHLTRENGALKVLSLDFKNKPSH